MADKPQGKILKTVGGALRGAQFKFAGMNSMLDPASIPIESGQCADICNCDIDNEHNISRRSGSTLRLNTPITSAWSNSSYSYVVTGGVLCWLLIAGEQMFANPIVDVPTLHGAVEFIQVNNIVVFSDGQTVGTLDGITASVLDQPEFSA